MKRDLGALRGGSFDVLVVGGGIQGAACAWDAAQRGLRTALVEREDFGGQTSWNSLKTIHGGLRYLQTLDLRRMRAGIAERRALLRIAGDLVRPLGFVVPAYGHGRAGREALAAALRLDRWIGHDRNRGLPPGQQLPPSRMLSRDELAALAPGLPLQGVSGGALYWDAQVWSSERLLLAFLHAAHEAGAVLANYCEVVALRRTPDSRVVGVHLVDREDREREAFGARAGVLLNCAGPNAGVINALAGMNGVSRPLLRAYNLVLGRAAVGPHAVGVRSGGRFLFAVPWNGVTMLGTGYEAAPYLDELADALPGAPGFLADCARAFPWLDLCDSDVRLVHEGLVPANGDASRVATRTWLRDHARDGARGVITVQAVKLTTARGVAERAVDVALRALGRAPVRCRTAETPLDLARPLLGGLRASLSATPEVNSGAAPPRGAPAPRTPGPDVPGLPTRCIDQAVRFAVREEQALHLGDVVLRRTDLGTAGPPSPDSVARVARVMAAELGWSDETLAEERRRYAAEEASLALSARRRAR